MEWGLNMLSAALSQWAGTGAPWWVTPFVTLASVIVTARATEHRDRRSEQRKAAVENREVIQATFEFAPTGPYPSFLPGERRLEIALIDLGFRRYESYDITRQLYDHRKQNTSIEDMVRMTLRELTRDAIMRANWRNLQDALGRYVSAEISLRRARRKMYGYVAMLRRERRARRWAKNQYRSFGSG